MDKKSSNMENDHQPKDPAAIHIREEEFPPGHRRSLSGSILSKLSFLRASADDNQIPNDKAPLSPEFTPGDDRTSPKKTGRAMAVAVQQHRYL